MSCPCVHLESEPYGRHQPAYRLPKDLTLTLVSGYSVSLRHKIVTRCEGCRAEVFNGPECPIRGRGRVRRITDGRCICRLEVVGTIKKAAHEAGKAEALKQA